MPVVQRQFSVVISFHQIILDDDELCGRDRVAFVFSFSVAVSHFWADEVRDFLDYIHILKVYRRKLASTAFKTLCNSSLRRQEWFQDWDKCIVRAQTYGDYTCGAKQHRRKYIAGGPVCVPEAMKPQSCIIRVLFLLHCISESSPARRDSEIESRFKKIWKEGHRLLDACFREPVRKRLSHRNKRSQCDRWSKISSMLAG